MVTLNPSKVFIMNRFMWYPEDGVRTRALSERTLIWALALIRISSSKNPWYGLWTLLSRVSSTRTDLSPSPDPICLKWFGKITLMVLWDPIWFQRTLLRPPPWAFSCWILIRRCTGVSFSWLRMFRAAWLIEEVGAAVELDPGAGGAAFAAGWFSGFVTRTCSGTGGRPSSSSWAHGSRTGPPSCTDHELAE